MTASNPRVKPKQREEEAVFYVVWLAWDKPIIGFSFPPDGRVPYKFLEDSGSYRKLEGVPPYDTKNTWLHIGDKHSRHYLRFADRDRAKAIADAVGGYVGED